MNLGRACFEERQYPDEYPEFKRLMAFCDANRLRMSFHEERGVLVGIRVYDRENNAITAYNRYTMYYSIPDKKIFFLDGNTWDDGMQFMMKILDKQQTKEDDDIIASLGETIS